MAPTKATGPGLPAIAVLQSPLITLVVGQGNDRQEIKVPKELLCHYSDYFAGAFRNNFEETRSGRFTFDDVDPITMNAFCFCLYFGRFQMAEQDGSLEGAADISRHFDKMTDVWALGDRLGAPLVQNAALDLFDGLAKSKDISVSDIRHIYEATRPGSLLRGYTVTRFAGSYPPETDALRCDDMPKDFLADLCYSFFDKKFKKNQKPWDEGEWPQVPWHDMVSRYYAPYNVASQNGQGELGGWGAAEEHTPWGGDWQFQG